MPIVDNRTPNLDLELPDLSNNTEDDVPRFINSFTKIDAHAAAVLTALAGKASAGHTHTMDQIVGLVAALAAKAAIDHVHALAGLTDVDITGAPNGAILKLLGTKWGPGSIALGDISGWEDTVNALIATAIAPKAPLASPAFTGNPTVPTQSPGNNSTRAASTAFVTAAVAAAIANLINGAPGALDALNELAAAMGNDPNFATTVTNAIAGCVKIATTAALQVGYTAAVLDTGNSGTAGWTPDPRLRNVQKRTVTGAFAISPPAYDCSMIIILQMGSGAGLVTLSSFSFLDPASDAFATTLNNRYKLYIDVLDGRSSVFVKAQQ